MFSGIVETTGKILQIKEEELRKHFTIKPSISFDDIKIGDSIAINGICLTTVQISEDFFTVTAVQETLQRTNLNFLTLNSSINLERALKYSDRMGGHYVQGHIDAMGQILSITDLLTTISVPPHLSKYLVNKGFITMDGMSITVIHANSDHFTVTLIPHTRDVTIAKDYKKDDWINLEVDIIGKHIEKLIRSYNHENYN